MGALRLSSRRRFASEPIPDEIRSIKALLSSLILTALPPLHAADVPLRAPAPFVYDGNPGRRKSELPVEPDKNAVFGPLGNSTDPKTPFLGLPEIQIPKKRRFVAHSEIQQGSKRRFWRCLGGRRSSFKAGGTGTEGPQNRAARR